MNNTYLKTTLRILLKIILIPYYCIKLIYWIADTIFRRLTSQTIKEDLEKATRGEIAFMIVIILGLLSVILNWNTLTEDKTLIPSAKAYDDILAYSGKWDITAPYLINGSWEQQEVIMNAWKISGGDTEFIKMLAGENGLFTHDRKSDVPGEDSWGYCQMHRAWHSDIVDDPRFWNDPYWQLEQCYKKWIGGTKFYGYNSKWLTVKKFIWYTY